ncbi:MAG: hypothetical protein WD673_10115 [Alphaproteobacteria bacterium]
MKALVAPLQFLSGLYLVVGVTVGAGALRHGVLAPVILYPGPYLAMAALTVMCALSGVSLMRFATWLAGYTDDRWSFSQLNLGAYKSRVLKMRPLR